MMSAARATSTSGSVANPVKLAKPPTTSRPALLKADTEWNTPHQAAVSGSLPCPRKASARMTIPAPSTSTVKTATRLMTFVALARSGVPTDSWTRTRSRSPVRRRVRTKSRRVEAVMKPSPPSWMSTRMVTCPSGFQYVPVSRTTRPVTQTAEVAVKRASTRGVHCPETDARGDIRMSVPMAMSRAKPRTRTADGEAGRRTRFAGATS